MTSAIPFPTYIIGLMSGTSADGVDAALLWTDGERVVKPGAHVFMPYNDGLRAQILGRMQGEGDEAEIAHSLTEVHARAVDELIKNASVPRETISLIGFHGQTIWHDPKNGRTHQIGNPEYLARETGIPVVFDFRSNDMRHGGQGAPLVPLYHAALAEPLPKPLMVVNIGGVSNVTWVGTPLDQACVAEGEPRSGGVSEAKGQRAPSNVELLAFDCGPGNALLDDWVHRHTGARYDAGGELAAAGKVDEAVLTVFLADAFLSTPAPKSLDRNHFHWVMEKVSGLSVADGAATLTAMTAAAIAQAAALAPVFPQQLLITGGGRHNPTLMRMINDFVNRTASTPIAVSPVESVGWNGDMLEAEAFAYLAARSVRRLPLSVPTTTGVKESVTGGVLVLP